MLYIYIYIYTKIYAIIKNITIAKQVRIYPSSILCGNIKIGNNSSIGRRKRSRILGFFEPTTILTSKEGFIKIGENTCLNGCYLNARESIIMGDNCRLASGVCILDHNGHEVYSLNRTVGSDAGVAVRIGSNVWIGLNSIILKGTEIGDNCIVAAGSVVKGVFDENCIIQGNPARVVKQIDLNLLKERNG